MNTIQVEIHNKPTRYVSHTFQVKSLNRSVSVRLNPCQSIRELKQEVKQMFKINRKQKVQLIMNNVELFSQAYQSDYGINGESIVHLVIRQEDENKISHERKK